MDEQELLDVESGRGVALHAIQELAGDRAPLLDREQGLQVSEETREVPDGERLGADEPVRLLGHQLVEDVEEPGHVALELLLTMHHSEQS